jgi:hypothetical protein
MHHAPQGKWRVLISFICRHISFFTNNSQDLSSSFPKAIIACPIKTNCLKVKQNYQGCCLMPESMQILIGITCVCLVSVLAMLGTGWWTKRICLSIIRELEEKGAINAKTAVSLPYDKVNYFKIGYRDYRPKALESLIISEIVIKTFDGQYYLNKEKPAENNVQTAS